MPKPRGLFVNTRKAKCSIHESGSMSFDCIKNSKLYDIAYTEVDEDHNSIPDGFDFYVFNYHPIPMGWLDTRCVRRLSGLKMTIVLEVTPNNPYVMTPQGDFDCYLVLDPTLKTIDTRVYPFPRPLENLHVSTRKPLRGAPVIGSFGFPTRGKGFELIVEAVSREFTKATVRLNVPFGDYVPQNEEMFEKIKRECLERKGSGISVEFSNTFFDKKELIEWCSENTINCFFYYRSMAGLSAVTDQAIASGRPMLTGTSQTFRHIHPYITPYPYQSIRSAIAHSHRGVEEMQRDWHPSKFLEAFERVITENEEHLAGGPREPREFALRRSGKSKVSDILHAMSVSDFVPPIVKKARKYFRRMKGRETGLPTLTPFTHPLLDSHSQFGEDLVLSLLLGGIRKGFYVDVGANDPVFNSNTKMFYDAGWHGINIEPTKEGYEKFLRARKGDVNLNVAVAEEEGTMTFYELGDDTTLSTLNPHNAELMSRSLGLPIRSRNIRTRPLSSVMKEFCKGKTVHLMSVDVEGIDLQVLKSNDWKTYRPEVLVVEGNNQFHEIVEFLDINGYLLLYNNSYNCIFINKTPASKAIGRSLHGWKDLSPRGL